MRSIFHPANFFHAYDILFLEAEGGGKQVPKGTAEGVAPPPTRPGEGPTAAGANSQEREAKEGRGRRENRCTSAQSCDCSIVMSENVLFCVVD